jgi:hypothetical protein
VFLKAESNEGMGFCEYFPHPELGDEGVDDFLASFAEQKTSSQKKAAYLLGPEWSKLYESKLFFNHQFFKEDDTLQSQVIKYKLKDRSDFSFLKLLENGLKIRLDANGLFDLESWTHFFRSLPPDMSDYLDYIEDPLKQLDWGDISLPVAKDFIQGDPYQVNIFKPYRELFIQSGKRTVFSGNMGHGLSNYQAYLELIEFGDLTDHHGILTDHFYEGTPKLFEGNFLEGFKPHHSALKQYFAQLESLAWTPL